MKLTQEWLLAALVRALRTFAQTFLGFLAVGAAMSDVDWMRAASVSGVAAIICIVTSVATGLPEAEIDGTITNEGEPTTATATLPNKVQSLSKKAVRLKVE